MKDSPYNFVLIQEDEKGKTYRIDYQGRDVGTIEEGKDKGMTVQLMNGRQWSGSLCGDMWDFLLAQEPFNQ